MYDVLPLLHWPFKHLLTRAEALASPDNTVCSQPSLESVARDTTKGKAISVPVTRTYYIQAEFDVWNYAPAGLDRYTCCGSTV